MQYGGRYYSYLVARAAANLVWTAKFQRDPFSSDAGTAWAEVQSHGGGLPPGQLLEKMLGYTPTSTHMIEAFKAESTNNSSIGIVNI